MPTGLKRYQANRDAHFVTVSCYRREARLAEPGAYETFARVFEQARKRHGLLVYGYVLMPEHVHLLVSAPPVTPLTTVLKARQAGVGQAAEGLTRPLLAASLSRLQRLYPGQDAGEAALPAPQPGGSRPGRAARGLALAQLPPLPDRSARYGRDRVVVDRTGPCRCVWTDSENYGFTY